MFTAVAIDGPAGAGKSTIARKVAEKLKYIYVDTGALYRAIGYYCIKNGVSPDGAAEVLDKIKVELKYVSGEQAVYLNGENVNGFIRTEDVSMAASAVSALPEVRAYLLELQRDMARHNNVIMDGRDIATVVLPDADVKIFLTASAAERARRRVKQLGEKGIIADYETVKSEIEERDYNDSHRAIAPLKPAQDSIYIDTSDIDLQESVETVYNTIITRR